jgi:hypothetical protein
MQSETERAIISRFNEENLTTLREAKVAVPEQMWTEEEAKERAWEEIAKVVEMLNLEEGVDSVR